MVEVQLVEKDDVAMKLVVQGMDVSLMNSLRRVVLTEVPTMTIDEVVMVENSSLLHDEILAHRLGLIPLRTDLDAYNLPEECPCKSEFGCNLCRSVLTLEVEASGDTMTVYSGDLKPEDPAVAPVSEKIPIVKLAPGQKIKLEAYARLGMGKTHAKWQPVSACGYKYLPKIKIDEEHCNLCDQCAEICPKRILVKVGERMEIQNLIECTLCRDCVEACPLNPPAVQVTWDQNTFVWNIESTGALSLERIVQEALKILDKKLKDFQSQLAEEGGSSQ